jgi:hypothetical protein
MEGLIVKSRLLIKAKQQSDTSWKAWAIGASLVVYAKTKMKAIDVVKMVLEDREKDQIKNLDNPQ